MICVGVAAALMLSAAASFGPDAPIAIDIHLPVTDAAATTALAASAYLHSKLKDDEIDFIATDTPHITLYLTVWQCTSPSPSTAECIESIKEAVDKTVKEVLAENQGACELTLTNPYAQGQYAFLNVSLTPCLQYYSDSIVNASFMFAQPNQTAPAWVSSLPEPERSEKIKDVALYGSPNVFSQFQPHVTVGWAADPDAVGAAVTAMASSSVLPNVSGFSSQLVAMGTVGPHGTVLKGKDYGEWNVSNGHDDGCTIMHPSDKDEKECKADLITDGGCVWCTLPKWEGLAVKQHACWSTVHAKTDPSFSALPASHLAETRKKLKCSN